MFFIVSVFLVVFPVVERPVELGIAIGICLAGIPVYILCIKLSPKSQKFSAFMGQFTSVCQLLCFGLPEEEEEDEEEKKEEAQPQRQVTGADGRE